MAISDGKSVIAQGQSFSLVKESSFDGSGTIKSGTDLICSSGDLVEPQTALREQSLTLILSLEKGRGDSLYLFSFRV